MVNTSFEMEFAFLKRKRRSLEQNLPYFDTELEQN